MAKMEMVVGAVGASRDLFEYWLIARPDAEVYERVMEEKISFDEEYAQAATKAQPHITVSSFYAKDGMEETLIRWLHRIVSEQRSFAVTLNNFSGIPAHTVFLR